MTVEFDVLAAGAGSYRSGYALVSDLRAEGVTEADSTDVRLARLLHLVSQYVDRMTGRFFEPRALTLAVDGSGGRAQLLGHPIICVREVKLIVALAAGLGELPITPSSFRVYNRHLTQGLTDLDDRENPRLEFFHESDLLGVQATPAASLGLGSLAWPRGAQNVVIDGLFGYTDPDGVSVGISRRERSLVTWRISSGVRPVAVLRAKGCQIIPEGRLLHNRFVHEKPIGK